MSCFYFLPLEALGKAILAPTPRGKPSASPGHAGVKCLHAALACLPWEHQAFRPLRAFPFGLKQPSRVVKLRMGSCFLWWLILAKAQSAEGDSMDINWNLCDAQDSHPEASSHLLRAKSGQKEFTEWPGQRGIRVQAVRCSVMLPAKVKVSQRLQFTLTSAKSKQPGLCWVWAALHPSEPLLGTALKTASVVLEWNRMTGF